MKKLLLITLFLLLPISVYGTTYTCGSGANSCTGGSTCTISNLNTCISNASDGDIISIASGTYNWTPSSSSYVNVNKRITISGGGYCGTSINDDSDVDCGDVQQPTGTWPVTINLPSSNDYCIFRINVTSGGSDTARISGLHITGDNYKQYMGCINTGGFIKVEATNIAQYRIDNNHFACSGTSYYNADIWTCNESYGLIDHNYFDPDSADGKGIVLLRLTGEGYPDSWEGNCADGWEDAVDFGSANFVFIEDNTMDRPSVSDFSSMFIDSFCGARFVIRYNYIRNAFSEFHGFSFGQYTTPGYAVEMYGNTFTNSQNSYRVWWFRGGTGLIYNNTISGTYGNCVFQFGENYRSSTSWGSITGSLDCDGNCQNGSSNPNNTNVDTDNGFPYDCGASGAPYPTGYPSLMTPGWGQTSGSTPSTVQPQGYTPIRIWNNDLSGTGSCAHALSETQSNTVCLNRDVYYCTDSSCALGGYTPYTYPHPLQGGDSVPPAPPVLAQ